MQTDVMTAISLAYRNHPEHVAEAIVANLMRKVRVSPSLFSSWTMVTHPDHKPIAVSDEAWFRLSEQGLEPLPESEPEREGAVA